MKTKLNTMMLSCALALCSGTAAASVNLVVNGSFEQGSTGWTTRGMSINQPGPGWEHSGVYAASTSCTAHDCVSTAANGAYFGQTIATTPGTSYDLSFWVGENNGPTSEFSVFWNGVMIADVVNPANYTLPNKGMVQFSFTDLPATGARTTFEIHGRQQPGVIAFDDVSVMSAAASVIPVPEPASMALLGLGAAALAATRRRRKPA